jgi:hypothetical protein
VCTKNLQQFNEKYEGDVMSKTYKPIEATVAQGWILMFLIFVCITIIEFLNASINANLSIYTSEEGAAAMKVMVVLMLLHAFVPMLVVTYDVRWFRWFVAVLTFLFGLLMMGHEIMHIFVAKSRGFGVFDLLDFSHHVLAIWVAILAVRWARVQ